MKWKPGDQMDNHDQQILARRVSAYRSRTGPQVGDYARLPNGTLRRFAYKWPDGFQITSLVSNHRSFFLAGDGASYSGVLDPSIPYSRIAPAYDEMRAANFWFFHHDRYAAHNDIHCVFAVPVWRILPDMED